ncbi:MAG: hypothetical protein LW707_06565 [Sphingobacteriales bacterium]|jgi:hypothetical protein|nr:hypothetical protein [Sphingobacteriales bacterium]
MNAYKFLFVLLTSVLTSHFSLAQPPQPGPEVKEEIESMRIAFFTRKLQLSPDEAKVFWPVFNSYTDEMSTLRHEHGKKMRSSREKIDNLNAAEIEKLADEEIAFGQQELDIRKKYHAQFKQVLPAKKVVMLYHAEDEFKRELIGRLRERKSDGPPPHHPHNHHRR